MSGLFQDQPSVEAMNELGLDVTSVGNHEFDEGLTELQRMVEGGCQPAPKGCFQDANGDDIPYAGTDFDYLGANVVDKNTGENLPWLPGTSIKTVDGVKVGFIGMTLEATPTLVNPVGVSAVNFEDEVETANAAVPALKAAGAEAIVVLIHEGGLQAAPSPYNGCNGISGRDHDDRAGPRPGDRRGHQRSHAPAVRLHDRRPGRRPAPGHERGVVRPGADRVAPQDRPHDR